MKSRHLSSLIVHQPRNEERETKKEKEVEKLDNWKLQLFN